MKSYGTKLIASIAAFVALIGGVFAFAFKSDSNSQGSQPVADNTSSGPAVATAEGSGAPAVSPSSKYKDGTYTATGSYMSPGGLDHLTVSLTLKNGVVTDSTVTPGPGDGVSAHYQQIFIGGYQSLVVGKSVDSIRLTRVSGSSLTPEGWNDAVSRIKAQAQA